MAWMIVILVIGIAVDSLVFGTLERTVRRRWGPHQLRPHRRCPPPPRRVDPRP